MKLTLLFIFFSIVVSAQESAMITGTILNDATDIEGVTIVNISLKVGAVTDADGTFKIAARVNDTLHLSALPYESREIIVTKAMRERRTLTLYLVPKINDLDEVVVRNIDLTGDLSKDIAGVNYKVFIDPRDLGIPANARPVMTLEERRYYGATAGAGPLGSLINAISGRTKMLKKHLEVARLQALVYSNKERFSDSLYIKNLQIPEKLIEDFVFYVFEDPEVLENFDQDNIFELLEIMQEKAPAYRKLKMKEQPSEN